MASRPNAEARAAAKKMGFTEIGETSHGQAVFKRGNDYITRDTEGHIGGAWKKANSVKDLGSKETRIGTFDKDLNPIRD